MIEFQDVTKRYGDTVAIDGLSIRLNQPGIYCLLGRNGAGKTTLLKLLAGHVAATAGTILVYEKPVGMLSMPEDVHFVETGAAQFNIRLTDLFNAAAQVNPAFDMNLAHNMARRFKLDLKKRFKHLSFGMKAMASTLIALSSGRDILVLDEPVLGFDPVMRRTFYELLRESIADKPKIVIVSTHIIDEIARVAEHLLVIDKGRLLLNCEMAEVDEKAYSVTGRDEQVRAATKGLRIIGETKAGGFLSQYIYDRRIEGGVNYAVSSLGLQDFFIGLVGGEEGAE
ncbi:ABC transporter ATP-binding protein [Clostridia bacterium]|nr:ABC transporter ATP-binding protein [Clostridia bacterium]